MTPGPRTPGTLFGPHGGVLDRADAALFTIVAGYYVWLAVAALTARPFPQAHPRPTIAAVPRRLAILGSTGSIGLQALDVVERQAGELRVVALSAASAWEPLRRTGARSTG